MTDDKPEPLGDLTVPTVDEIKLIREEHIVTEPIRPCGGSSDTDEDNE